VGILYTNIRSNLKELLDGEFYRLGYEKE